MTEHKSLAAALAAFQVEDGLTFAKTRTAKVQTKAGGSYSYNYADLSDILPVVRPLLSKHGLCWTAMPARAEDGTLVLRYTLLHVSGDAEGAEMPLGVESGCKPQELGSAITYARRYAITAQLNISTEEDDDGRAAQNAPKSAPMVQSAPSVKLATAADVKEMLAAAKGLPDEMVKLALGSCGLDNVTSYNRVPADKVAQLVAAFGGAQS